MKRIISMLLAMIMVLSTVSISVFAEESTEEVTTASDEMQEPCIGKEVEYGSDLYSIQNDGLYVSKNYGRDTLMDEGTITWVIERDGVLYWSKLDEYNTDIYRMNLSNGSETTLTRLFVPAEAFDVVGDDVYYLYNGEITKSNILKKEETSIMIDQRIHGFYLDNDGNICRINPVNNTSVYSVAAQTQAISKSNIEKRIDELYSLLGNKYFTTDQKSASSSDERSRNSKVIETQWFKTMFGINSLSVSQFAGSPRTYANAKSCSGFATFAHWYIFRDSNTSNVRINELNKMNFNKENVLNTAKIGDIISLSGTKSNGETAGHELIFLSADKDGIYVLDSNWANSCKVTKHHIAYSYCTKFQVGRATNYPINNCEYDRHGYCASCKEISNGADVSGDYYSELGVYKKTGSGGVDAFKYAYKWNDYKRSDGKVNQNTVTVKSVYENENGTLNYYVYYGDKKAYVNRNDFRTKYAIAPEEKEPSDITFEGMKYPEKLNKGSGFGLRGTITSTNPIYSVKGVIVRASDHYERLPYTHSNVGQKTYKITANNIINTKLDFGVLSPDTYYLKYVVTDTEGFTEEWKSPNFTVGNVGTVPTLRVGDITGGKKIDISCSDKNAVIKYTVDGGKEQSISAGGSKTIEFKTAGNHTVVAWSVSGTTVSTKGTQSIKIEKAWLPTIIDWFRRKAGVLADIDVEYGNTSAQVIISGEGDLYYTLNGSNPTTSSAKYTGPVEIKNSCTVKAISVQQGYAPSDVATKDIIIREPDAPSIQLSNTKQKIAQGKTATVSWSKVNYATKYVAYLYYNGECVDTYETTGTSASFILPEVGKYTINVKAHNFVGYSPESNSVSVMSMAPVTVTIVDQVIREGEVTDDVVGQIQQNINEHDGEDAITVEGNVISVQKIDYDSLPARPMTPSKKGFTFAGYGEGMFVPATTDKTIYALYEVNYYTVEFWNSYYSEDGTKEVKKQIGATQEILYTYAATLPEVTSPDGYSLAGWNVDNTISTGFDYNYVDGNIKLYTSYTWTNKDLPAIVQIEHVERDEKCTSYAVDIKYINNNFETNGTQARLIISMYTSDGRMIYTQTEDVDMDLFKIGQTLTDTITLNYVHNVAKVSAVMVQVKNDKTGGAISEMDYTEEIEYPDASTYWDKWSEWSTTPYYESDTRQVEKKTQYRYQDKIPGTSTNTKNLGGDWHYSHTTSSTGNWIDNGTNWVGEENSDYRRREVSTTWHDTYKQQWLYSRAVGWSSSSNCWKAYGWVTGICQTVEGTGWLDYRLPYEGEGPCGSKWGKGWINGKNVYWYNEVTQTVKSGGYNTYAYRDTYYTHYFWRWGDFSAWSDTVYYKSDSRNVETRPMYRYRDEKPVYPGYNPNNDSGFEEQTIEKFDVSGNIEGLENDYTGKLATIMVYKKTNTDPTQEQLQYVDQIPLGENNAYSFTVNAKEKLDYSETGDFIVTLAIEGCDKLVNIDVIQAPVPTYAVNFYTSDGVQYGETQYVEYGGGVDVNAIGIPEKEGYRFVKWDKSVVNITRDISVNAVFEPKEYTVVFVDHENETTEIKELSYGSPIPIPAVNTVDGKVFLGWEGLDPENENVVFGSQVYTANWENNIYTVKFCDFDGNQIGETQEVEYGEAAELPESVVVEGMTYPWDTNSEEWWNVTHDMTIYPYSYSPSSLIAPATDVAPGDYDEYLLVNLSADEGSTIYYSEYDITEEDAERFVEMQEAATVDGTEEILLLAEEETTIGETDEGEETENDYSYLNDIIVEYDEAIPVTGSTIIYAFTVKDGEFSPVTSFEYNINDFEPQENESELDETIEQITMPKLSVKPGEQITIPISIKNNPGLMNLSLVLGYDSEKFTLVSAENGNVFDSSEFTKELNNDGSCKFTWTTEELNTTDGTLVNMTFKVADEVGEGEYLIEFTDSEAMGEEEQQYFALVDATIANSATVFGDVNGDGWIDFSDAILILKHDVGLTTLPSDKLPAGDVNGDGDVDFSDAILILKLDAGLITSFN